MGYEIEQRVLKKNYLRNTNQNYFETLSHPSQNGCYQENKFQWACVEGRSFIYCCWSVNWCSYYEISVGVSQNLNDDFIYSLNSTLWGRGSQYKNELILA